MFATAGCNADGTSFPFVRAVSDASQKLIVPVYFFPHHVLWLTYADSQIHDLRDRWLEWDSIKRTCSGVAILGPMSIPTKAHAGQSSMHKVVDLRTAPLRDTNLMNI